MWMNIYEMNKKYNNKYNHHAWLFWAEGQVKMYRTYREIVNNLGRNFSLKSWTLFPVWALRYQFWETFTTYRNDPKFSDTQNICCSHSKVWTMWLYHRLMSPNDAVMANSVDPDQTAPIWVCTVCQGLSVRKLRIVTVQVHIFPTNHYPLEWLNSPYTSLTHPDTVQYWCLSGFVCFEVYDPVNTIKVMSSQSVNLSTLFLGGFLSG